MQTRAALRQVLGHCLGLPPLAIGLEEGHHGKPRLAASLPRLEFNVSHSGQLALIALGRTPLGIDLEHLDRPLDWRELAPACCHPDELPALRRMPDPDGHRQFLRLWTLREAYVKGTGEGLSQPPADIRLEYGDAAWPDAARRLCGQSRRYHEKPGRQTESADCDAMVTRYHGR